MFQAMWDRRGAVTVRSGNAASTGSRDRPAGPDGIESARRAVQRRRLRRRGGLRAGTGPRSGATTPCRSHPPTSPRYSLMPAVKSKHPLTPHPPAGGSATAPPVIEVSLLNSRPPHRCRSARYALMNSSISAVARDHPCIIGPTAYTLITLSNGGFRHE